MADFDPYLQWLGIRDPQRPPNHYRLLGLELFEANESVIANAADRQMAHVRTFQSGQHAETSQRVLNELAAARVCLLKPEKKAAYDQQLRAKTAAARPAPPMPKPLPVGAPATPRAAVATAPATRPVAARPVPSAAVATADDSPFAEIAAATASAHTTSRRKRKPQKSLAPYAFAAVALAAISLISLLVLRSNQKPQVAVGHTTTQPVEESKPTTTPDKPDTTTVPSTDKELPEDNRPDTKPEVVEPTKPETDKPVIEESPTGSEPNEPSNPESAETAPGDEATGEETDATEEAPAESSEEEPADKPEESPAPIQKPVDPRLPVPEKEAQKAALEIIKDLFKSEFAARKPDDRAALAKKLLTQGDETTGDPTSSYVLYDQSMALAAGTGDTETAITAADRLGKKYQVDALEVKSTSLATLSRTANQPDSLRALATVADQLTQESIDQDNYDAAKRFNALTLAAARKIKDPSLVSQTQDRLRDLKHLEAEYNQVETAFAKLKESSDDPDANLAVGKYLCFAKGDFDQGLNFLEKGSDPELKDLARREVHPAQPLDAKQLVELGNLWWARASREGGDAALSMRFHAGSHYQVALPELQGLTKAGVDAKLAELAAAEKTSKGGRSVRPADFLTRHVWRFEFVRDSGERTVYPRVVFSADGTCESSLVGLGHWQIEGDWIVIQYTQYPKMLQRIKIAAGQAQGECYNPIGTLTSRVYATRLN